MFSCITNAKFNYHKNSIIFLAMQLGINTILIVHKDF